MHCIYIFFMYNKYGEFLPSQTSGSAVDHKARGVLEWTKWEMRVRLSAVSDCTQPQNTLDTLQTRALGFIFI